jgi:NADH-quinone oxidoreductase subunit A
MMSGIDHAVQALWPFAVYSVAVAGLTAGILVFSYLLGERHKDRGTDRPYECGILPTGPGRMNYPARFYLVAVCFVVFDIEAVFVFAWAVCARETGWRGYAAMTVFIAILFAALAYLWRTGALDWGSAGRRRPEAGRRNA